MELQDLINKFNKKGDLYFKVRVIPGSAKTELKDIMDDNTLKITVKAPPEKGKANKELIKYISGIFNVSTNNIVIAGGLTGRSKVIHIYKT